MTLYAESSAVLAWLLGEKSGEAIRRALLGADLVVASDLTVFECDRACFDQCTPSRAVRQMQPADEDTCPQLRQGGTCSVCTRTSLSGLGSPSLLNQSERSTRCIWQARFPPGQQSRGCQCSRSTNASARTHGNWDSHCFLGNARRPSCEGPAVHVSAANRQSRIVPMTVA